MNNNSAAAIVAELSATAHDEDGWLSDAQDAQLEVHNDGVISFCGEGTIDLWHAAEIALRTADAHRASATVVAPAARPFTGDDDPTVASGAERLWEDTVGDSGEAPTGSELAIFADAIIKAYEAARTVPADAPISVQDVRDDLTTTNEMGDGGEFYFVRDGRLFVNKYVEGTEPTGTYQVDIALTQVDTITDVF